MHEQGELTQLQQYVYIFVPQTCFVDEHEDMTQDERFQLTQKRSEVSGIHPPSLFVLQQFFD
jgi:glyoxylate utilization-related uncharacterized protein